MAMHCSCMHHDLAHSCASRSLANNSPQRFCTQWTPRRVASAPLAAIPPTAAPLSLAADGLHIDGISAAYDGPPVLHNVAIQAPPGALTV